MLAKRISPDQALEWNMIYRAVSDGALQSDGIAFAQKLATGPTKAYGLIRQTMRQAQSSSFVEALSLEQEAQRVCRNSEDCRNAVKAFAAKKSPEFTGR